MHILSWNVNGLRAWSKKQGTVEFISRPEIDIVCLNETRIDQSLVKSFEKKFSLYPYQYWACSIRKGYAGVAILSKFEPISSNIGYLQEYDMDGRVITLEFQQFYLIACYFPNSGGNDEFIDKKNTWDNAFRDYLSELINKGKEIIWIGDLNIVGSELDYFERKGQKVKINPLETESFKRFIELGFIDTFRWFNAGVRKFTWFSNKFPQHRINNRGWRIDYAMVTKGCLPWVENSLIWEDIMGSDHSPIEIIINIPG